jgi:uncharacterized phosphosugar-binding protein
VRAGEYAAVVQQRIDAILLTQVPAIETAAAIVADALGAGGRLHVAQTSHTLHLEATHRAGGLMGVSVLDDLAAVRPGDAVIVGTPAGTWAYPIEIALGARDRGARVIAISSEAFETDPRVPLGHASGRRLRDVADVAIDADGPYGDGETVLADEAIPIIPSSGATGVTVLWMILAEAVELLAQRGLAPLVWQSNLLAGAPERNAREQAEFEAGGPPVRPIARSST